MQCEKLRTYMETGRVIFVPARSIRPNPAQPRKIFDPQALEELTESIRRHGILQPLSVRRIDSFYELIAGERRLRAARAAGLSEIPCIVMNMDDRESGLAALVENLQRQDLDFIEEAMGISRLIRMQNLSQDQAARMLGKSQSAVANKLRLLRHSPEILRLIREAGLSERHARALLALENDGEKRAAVARIARLGLSAAKTEEYIRQLTREKRSRPEKNVNLSGFFTGLSQTLDRFRSAGIPAVSEQRETEKEIILTITIPKRAVPADGPACATDGSKHTSPAEVL